MYVVSAQCRLSNYSEAKGKETMSYVTIRDVDVPIKRKEIVDCNILRVEAGTTGHKGGDTGHGGRTYFSITDEASTDMEVNVFDNGFEVMLGGDTELDTMIEALEFIVKTLKEKR